MPMIPCTEEQKKILFDAQIKNDGVLFAITRKDGTHVPVFSDAVPMMWSPESFRLASELLAKRVIEINPDVVAGGLTGGAPIAAAVAVLADKPYTLIRKEAKKYSQSRLVDGIINKGDKVVLCDDFFLHGEMSDVFRGFVEQSGGTVTHVLTYGKRDEEHTNAWGKERNIEMEAIYTYEENSRYLFEKGVIDQEGLDLVTAFVKNSKTWHKDPTYAKRAEAYFEKHGKQVQM